MASSRPPPPQHVSKRPTSLAEVLDKTQYRELLAAKDSESCRWLSVVVAQYLALCRVHDTFRTWCATLIDNSVNGPNRPGFIAPVVIRRLDLGESFPVLALIHAVAPPTGRQASAVRARLRTRAWSPRGSNAGRRACGSAHASPVRGTLAAVTGHRLRAYARG